MRCLLKLVCSTDIIDLMLSININNVMYAIWLINEKMGKSKRNGKIEGRTD